MDWDATEIAFIIERALAEDLGTGDITSQTLLPEPLEISAVFVAKQQGVLAGLPLVWRIFRKLDSGCRITEFMKDGDRLYAGVPICRVEGRATTLLAGERSALNFVQRLSGIATQTATYVALASPAGITILDTRKTTPLLRRLEKYAVRVGGGSNHRTGLFDGVLVKDNHLKLQPDFQTILRKFAAKGYPSDKVEIEVTSLSMLKSAIDAGALNFLLDNMDASEIQGCVKLKTSGMHFEVSGGITPENLPHYLIPGVDAISIGGLTHSIRSLDISMEIE